MRIRRAGLLLVCVILAELMPVALATAQSAPDAPPAVTTMFSHPDNYRWWLSGQVNVISQMHGTFPSPYEGANSLRPNREQALSSLWTVYTGLALPGHTELLFDVESAGGGGLSDALGLAGFTNLDVVRNPTLGSVPYVARVMVHVTLPLSDEMSEATSSPLALAARVPTRRIEIRVGKVSLADVFDVNAVGSDGHLQFTNWTVDNNGAYDYAADTRGYTYAAIVEYDTRRWSARFGEALMPTVANGITLDWDLSRARAENLELELRPVAGLVVKLLGYANHANMGNYNEAIDGFLSGRDARPDVVAYRRQGRVKTGIGLGAENSFRAPVRVFMRAGWNEGANNTMEAGGDLRSGLWSRPEDRVGAALVSNGLSEAHREYLALGGLGFLLGDGALAYGREEIVETYDTAQLWRGLSASAGLQFIDHPGYNRDRGPVLVEMLRLHAEF